MIPEDALCPPGSVELGAAVLSVLKHPPGQRGDWRRKSYTSASPFVTALLSPDDPRSGSRREG